MTETLPEGTKTKPVTEGVSDWVFADATCKAAFWRGVNDAERSRKQMWTPKNNGGYESHIVQLAYRIGFERQVICNVEYLTTARDTGNGGKPDDVGAGEYRSSLKMCLGHGD